MNNSESVESTIRKLLCFFSSVESRQPAATLLERRIEATKRAIDSITDLLEVR